MATSRYLKAKAISRHPIAETEASAIGASRYSTPRGPEASPSYNTSVYDPFGGTGSALFAFTPSPKSAGPQIRESLGASHHRCWLGDRTGGFTYHLFRDEPGLRASTGYQLVGPAEDKP